MRFKKRTSFNQVDTSATFSATRKGVRLIVKNGVKARCKIVLKLFKESDVSMGCTDIRRQLVGYSHSDIAYAVAKLYNAGYLRCNKGQYSFAGDPK